MRLGLSCTGFIPDILIIEYVLQQYATARGNIPIRVVKEQINRAPHAAEPRTKSKYPHQYRNQEGPANAPRSNFATWETRSGSTTLYEYPVQVPIQQNPQTGQIQRHFDYDRKASKARQAESQARRSSNEPLETGNASTLSQATTDENGPGSCQRPGPIRGVTDRHRNIIGAMAHPQGNLTGFARAPLQPLDREGRQYIRTDQDYRLHSSNTFPRR